VLDDVENDENLSYQLRLAKITMEHEVLLKEMEIAITTQVALIIAVMGLIASIRFFETPTYLVLVTFILIIVASMLIGWLQNTREDKKGQIESKQSEVDVLLNELAEKQKKSNS
jgi:membrane protein implicated in regulation of membrane protease activity